MQLSSFIGVADATPQDHQHDVTVREAVQAALTYECIIDGDGSGDDVHTARDPWPEPVSERAAAQCGSGALPVDVDSASFLALQERLFAHRSAASLQLNLGPSSKKEDEDEEEEAKGTTGKEVDGKASPLIHFGSMPDDKGAEENDDVRSLPSPALPDAAAAAQGRCHR